MDIPDNRHLFRGMTRFVIVHTMTIYQQNENVSRYRHNMDISCYFNGVTFNQSGEIMQNITSNSFPFTRRFEITNTATAFSIPRAATKVSFGGTEKINFSFEGNEGDTFGDGQSDNNHFSFVPANNMTEIVLEKGNQSNRILYIGSETSTAKISFVIEKQ